MFYRQEMAAWVVPEQPISKSIFNDIEQAENVFTMEKSTLSFQSRAPTFRAMVDPNL